MYKIIFILEKPVTAIHHGFKDITGSSKQNAYITKQFRDWDATLTRLKEFSEYCRADNNLITSAQVIHESKINNTDL